MEEYGNPFSDLAKKQNEFIKWIVTKFQEHEEKLENITIELDMMKNSSVLRDHETRICSLKEQVRMLSDKISAGKAPSALKSLTTGAKKIVRLNSAADDLEAEKKSVSPRPSPEQTALGEDILANLEEVTQQMMEEPRTQRLATGTSIGTSASMDSMELPVTLTQAIDTTIVGNSPGTAGSRSRRTCMIPKFDDLLADEKISSIPYVPRFEASAHVPDVTSEAKLPDAAVDRTNVSSLLSEAKASCVTPGSIQSDESPTAGSPRAARARTNTDQVDLDSYQTGEYIIINSVIVTDAMQSKTSLTRLKEGDLVKVIQVDIDNIRRIRGEIESPVKGWINVKNLTTDQVYAEKATKCSKCENFKVKGVKDADGTWHCVDCRGHVRATRRLPQGVQIKCDHCSNTLPAAMGRDDPSSGSWYCTTCWEAWK